MISEEVGVVFSVLFAIAEVFILPIYTLVGVVQSAKELYQFEHDPDFFHNLGVSQMDYSGFEQLEHLEWGSAQAN